MSEPSDQDRSNQLRQKIIGLGEKSMSKSYYPELRRRLGLARTNAPYFDMTGFTRHLEALYHRMWQRHEKGLEPDTLGLPYSLEQPRHD